MLTWTTRELADIFNMSISGVRGWVNKGWLRAVKTSNYEGLQISCRDLMNFLDSHQYYKDIFVHKLTSEGLIGGKNSRSVLQYFLKEGLLK